MRTPNQSCLRRVRRLEERLLRPGGPVAHEHVRGPGRIVHGLVLVAARGVDPGDQAVFVGCARGDRVPVVADGHRVAERVAVFGVVGLDAGLMRPGAAAAREHVERALAAVRVVLGDRERVAVLAEPDRVPEQHVRARHRRLDVRLLRPGAASPREDVGRTGLVRRIVCLVAVDAGRVAVFADGAHRQRVAVVAQRNRVAELVAFSEVLADRGVARVRRLDVGLLRPGVAACA